MAVSSVVWQLQLSPQCNQIEAALPPSATVTGRGSGLSTLCDKLD